MAPQAIFCLCGVYNTKEFHWFWSSANIFRAWLPPGLPPGVGGSTWVALLLRTQSATPPHRGVALGGSRLPPQGIPARGQIVPRNRCYPPHGGTMNTPILVSLKSEVICVLKLFEKWDLVIFRFLALKRITNRRYPRKLRGCYYVYLTVLVLFLWKKLQKQKSNSGKRSWIKNIKIVNFVNFDRFCSILLDFARFCSNFINFWWLSWAQNDPFWWRLGPLPRTP